MGYKGKETQGYREKGYYMKLHVWTFLKLSRTIEFKESLIHYRKTSKKQMNQLSWGLWLCGSSKINFCKHYWLMTSLVAQMVKCLPTMRETRVQSLVQKDLWEKEMAAHSSILAWKIPWTEEPGRLQSMGSQRVGHNWATSLSLSDTIKYDCKLW